MIIVVLLILVIIVVYYIFIYEGFDPLNNEFLQVPGRLLNWLVKGLSNIDLGYGRGFGNSMEYGPCPPNSSENWARDCYANTADREDGRNEGEAWGKSWDKGDGCSWNRHMEGGMCFRACPDGFFGRAHERCWANGANSLGVMKYGVDRLVCKNDEDHVGLLCYPKCRSGYKSVAGVPNICVPNYW